MSMRLIFMRTFQAAGSLALAGLLMFAIAGGFSSARYLSPVSFQGIDPAALHAEAQAIDMQINVANLSYAESSNTGGSTAMVVTPSHTTSSSSSKVAAVATPMSVSQTTVTSSATSSALTGTSTPSTTYSINEALQQLEQ
jgi:hypothetical protein